jgi:hypothetical protein
MNEEIKWTNLTRKAISATFRERGYEVSEYIVDQLLRKHRFVKRKMRKTQTVKEAAHRNEQFEQIQRRREEYTEQGNPILSMDVKKREYREFLS